MLSRGPLVVATVVRTQGSVPRQAGAKLAVGSDGTLLGTVGGGAAEAEVIARAQTLLQTAVPVGDGDGESSPAGMPVSLDLNSPPLGVCGGRMHIWLQRWQGSPAQTLAAQILQALTQGQRAWLITPLHPQGFPYLRLGDSNVEHFAPSSATPLPRAAHTWWDRSQSHAAKRLTLPPPAAKPPAPPAAQSASGHRRDGQR